MKNSYVLFLSVIIFFSAILLAGCKKEDTTLPIIELKGDNPMLIILNSAITDPGASAKDDKDGELIVTSDWNMNSTPNVNYAGTYTVTYTAVDKSDNKATKSRVVIVRNDAYYLEGYYKTTQGTSIWYQNITASKTDNNRILFSKFANFNNNNNIYAVVSGGTQVDIPSPQDGVGSTGCAHTFAPDGIGNPITTTPSPLTFSIKFTDEELAVDANCPGAGPYSLEDLFEKQ